MESSSIYHEAKNFRSIEYKQHGFSEDLYMNLCGVEKCLPGKSFGTAARDGYHLHAVLSGKGKLWIEGKEFDVHAGQLFVTVPGKEVFYKADEKDPWYYCWISYDGAKAKELLESAGFTEEVYVRNSMVDISSFLSVIQALFKKPDLNFSSDLYRMGWGYQFLSLAIESFEKMEPAKAKINNLSAEDYVEYAINYINGNYSSTKISNVAEYVGVNRSYLTTIFKEKMCMSPQEYLMQVRMSKAIRLLEESDLPINRIAQGIGYSNPLTFSKIFKQKYGVSPENYRKKQER